MSAEVLLQMASYSADSLLSCPSLLRLAPPKVIILIRAAVNDPEPDRVVAGYYPPVVRGRDPGRQFAVSRKNL